MAEQTKEQFYDEQVAPLLAGLAKQCEKNGLSLLAACEWEPGKYGSTALFQDETGFGMKMARFAVHANGNIDSFMFAVMKHAREHGHSSAILRQLGIPLQPKEPA